jgi:hypothetical protein
MVRINLKRAVKHVPHGHIHGIDFVPGEQDVHEQDAETFIREGWADPLADAPADEGADTAANGQQDGSTTPDPDQPSPDSGQAEPSSASRPAPASPKPRRKPAAKRKPPAKPG